jgi:DNA-binding NarL/FixJ family response regulator
LAAVWQDVLEGRLTIYSEGAGPRGRYVLCRSVEGATLESLLSRVETAVLVRVLGGEQQKAVALELGMACSTASKWYTSALGKLHLDVGPIPMPLIVAAQAWAAGTSPAVGARRATVDYQGTEFVLVSLPCADAQREPLLTPAEREVAQLLIEGRSRWEIAAHRSTSSQTVACQLRGIFGKLRVSGRCSLIKRAVGTGWFRG